MTPGDIVPDPSEHCAPGFLVRIIRVHGETVTARRTGHGFGFVRWTVDSNGKRVGSTVSGPYAHSFGCLESEGLEGA